MHRRNPTIIFALTASLASLANEARAAETPPTFLVVDAEGPTDIDRDALRDVLARDLHTTIEPREAPSSDASAAQITVQVRGGHTVLVTYRDASGRTLARAIEVTGDTAALTSAAALLAENLAHDQTSDLLPAEPTKASVTASVEPQAARAKPEGDTDASGTPQNAAPRVPVIASLFYPLATNFGNPNARTPFSLDALVGRNGGLDGVSVSGLAGWSSGAVAGAQIAGLSAIAKDMAGAQIAGGANIAANVDGAQITGAVNVAKNVSGAQIAGVVNTLSELHGAQVSVINIGGDVDGAQVGVVNIGKRVRGLQLGVVNVADDVDGASFGLVSLIKRGEVRAVGWASTSSDSFYGNAGVQWASKNAYALVQGALGEDHIGPGIRLGARVPIGRLHVDADVGTVQLFATNGNASGTTRDSGKGGAFFGKGTFIDGRTGQWLKTGGYSNHEARVLLGVDVTSYLSAFAGGGLSVSVSSEDATNIRLGPTFVLGLSIGSERRGPSSP